MRSNNVGFLFYRSGIIIVFLLITLTGYSRTPAKIILRADTSTTWFLSGYLPLGCEAVWASGRIRRTTGFMNGNMLWDKLIVTSAQGSCNDGHFRLDPEACRKSGSPIRIQVAWKADTSIKHVLILPMPKPVSMEIALREDVRVIENAVFSPDLLITYSNGYLYRASPWRSDRYFKPQEATLYMGKDLLADGKIHVNGDRLSLVEGIQLYAVLRDYPGVIAERRLYPEYDKQYILDFQAATPEKARNGHRGSGGGAGEKGENGIRGEHADSTDIFIRLTSNKNILHITCRQGSQKKEAIVRAGLDQTEIIVTGMPGGEGGDGGEGDDAASGSGLSGGRGGDGGDGGRGGDGSHVTIWCEKEAERFLPSIMINNLGGAGGAGGKGGKGGISDDGDENTSIFDLLFPYRNESGYGGYTGENGRDGGEARVYIVTKEVIEEMVNGK